MKIEGEDTVKRIKYESRPLTLIDSMYVEWGSKGSWDELKDLHYKAQSLGIGQRHMRLVLNDGSEKGKTIGAMVFTVPKPLDSGRNKVFNHMSPNKMGGLDTRHRNRMRMQWMNRSNILLSSRTVLDTMYRGAGLAYRFKNIGYRLAGWRFVESRSSMSRYNPFSVKAGMKFIAPKSSASLDKGLALFKKWFDSPAYDYFAIKKEIEGMPDWLQVKCLFELREFYYKNSSMEKSGENRLNGMSRIDSMETGYLLKQIQQLSFGQTIYAIWQNPDMVETRKNVYELRSDMPERIPLNAFSHQAVDEPLRVDLLKI